MRQYKVDQEYSENQGNLKILLWVLLILGLMSSVFGCKPPPRAPTIHDNREIDTITAVSLNVTPTGPGYSSFFRDTFKVLVPWGYKQTLVISDTTWIWRSNKRADIGQMWKYDNLGGVKTYLPLDSITSQPVLVVFIPEDKP